MNPLKLTVDGIGAYRRKCVIDFTTCRSPVALCAPMGNGKTWLIESIFAALFGRYLWYGSNIYDGMTLGGTGKASIELDFEHKGIQY